jgi:LPXTG-site transpeptidase (sortase) family protein
LALTPGRALPGPLAAVLTALVLTVGGCGSQPLPEASAPGASVSTPVPDARVGSPAPSARVHFVPTLLVLPGGARAPVEPAQTVGGELVVPENVQHVGWWDGSAYAGDVYGSTVIAGHVDSATEGLGFFARLLRLEPGEVVSVRRGSHRQRYRILSVRAVAKQALATSGSAFDQTGEHRLVLITCAGRYRAGQGGYESNLVVTAAPVGAAH